MNYKVKSQRGFTIIELLIATSVFSVVLLVVTTGVIKIGQSYYKGVITSRTQETNRNITEDISRAFQLASGGKRWGANGVNGNQFCVGDTRYTFNLNRKVATGVDGLVSEKMGPNEACNDAAAGSNRRELLATHMRLLMFDVTSADSLNRTWRVHIKIGYGDNDLMTHYQNNGTTPVGWNGTDNSSPAVRGALCKSGIPGGSFCATSELDILVKKRLN